MEYVIFGGIYIVSFTINYIFVRKTESDPGVLEFLITVTPIMNAMTTIFIFAFLMDTASRREGGFIRKFFGVNRKG